MNCTHAFEGVKPDIFDLFSHIDELCAADLIASAFIVSGIATILTVGPNTAEFGQLDD